MMMDKTLGILVTSGRYFDYVLKLCRAADEKGITTRVFMTGDSIERIQDSKFDELVNLAAIHICEASFRIGDKKKTVDSDSRIHQTMISTHAKNAQMAKECDRYLVF